MHASALTSEVDSREDMKRLHFRRLKRCSSTMNPLDSGRLDLYCGHRSRKTDMATAISNFTSRGGDFERPLCCPRQDDDRRIPRCSVAEPELQLASLGF